MTSATSTTEVGMEARVAALGHVGIASSDIDRTIEFYTRLVGLTLTEKFDYGESRIGHGRTVIAGAFLRAGSDHHVLSVFKLREAQDLPEGPHNGLHHIAFALASPQELVDLYRKFRDAGAPIIDARIGGPGNHPRFYAYDPDGNQLEFYWGTDQIGWDGLTRPYPPIESIDLETFDFESFMELRDSHAASAREQYDRGAATYPDIAD
ncbi:MAG: VOC family protein [bacterium]|nr:VOC family protein [bacterium]